jgi:hypothetical protein
MSRELNNVERRERDGLGGRRNWDSGRDGNDPYSRNRQTRGAGWEGSPVTGYREADPSEFRYRDDRDDRYDDRDDWDRRRRYQQQPVNWGRERDDERRYRRSGDDRFGSMDDVRVRYGRDDDRGDDWSREAGYASTSGYSRRDDDRNWDRADRRGWETQQYSGQRQGQYAGRGPRGYRRSDERIREDVSELLWVHGDIDASDIDVTVQDSEVTLEGTVDSRWTKRLAEDVANEARGVVDVHNRLRIRREQAAGWDRGADVMTRSEPRTNQQGAVAGNVMLEGGRTAPGLAFAPDMQVVGSEGDEVGLVKEVRSDTILVDRPMSRDIYIPFSAVNVTDGSTARLNVRSDEVDNQGWQTPPMTGTDTDYEESVQLT